MSDSDKSGARLAVLREDRKISLSDLATRSGVPVAEIEAIENGSLSPSIAPLVKLSRALGVRLGTFLDDAGGEGPIVCKGGEASEVMRAPSGSSPKSGSMHFFSLAKDKTGRSMEPFIVDIGPGVKAGLAPSTHEGEEFIYVLQGEIEVTYGAETRKLGVGDSIYYDSIVPHRVSAPVPAKVLAVIYAPY